MVSTHDAPWILCRVPLCASERLGSYVIPTEACALRPVSVASRGARRDLHGVPQGVAFFTRRYSNAFTPNGCARCTFAPAAWSVYCPVPAVGGLQDHLGILPSTRDHPVQALDIIEDPNRLQHLPGIGHQDQDPVVVAFGAPPA